MWDVANPTRTTNKCHVQERHIADKSENWFNFPLPFLASTPIIFGNKLEGDSICFSYKFFLRTIHPSTFYEP